MSMTQLVTPVCGQGAERGDAGAEPAFYLLFQSQSVGEWSSVFRLGLLFADYHFWKCPRNLPRGVPPR